MPKIKIQGVEKVVSLKELRELGGQLNEQIRTMAGELQARKAKHDAGKDVELWPGESKAQWDARNADYNECARALQEENAAAQAVARAAELDNSRGEQLPSDGNGDTGDRRTNDRTNRADAFEAGLRAWFLSQYNRPVDQRDAQAAAQCGIQLSAREMGISLLDSRSFNQLRFRVTRVHPERRDMSAVTGGSGGYMVPEGFVSQLETALLYFGPMLEACNVITTDAGNDLPWPTVNDTGNTGEQLGESSDIGSSVDPTVAAVNLGAYKFSSKLVKVPVELIEDAAFDLVTWLGTALGQRLGRIVNTKCTTGDGAAGPTGILTAATLGKTTASATAIDETELIDLYHSVDRAYRAGPQVGWMMNDLIAAEVRKLQATNGDFYLSGLASGEPDSIMGKRLWFNNDLASTLTATYKTALFGDFSKYVVRRVRGIRLRRLVERYADYDQEGFVAFMRVDGALIDAGTHPVKYLQQHA
jgi:HK97 family phage major capsid protein